MLPSAYGALLHFAPAVSTPYALDGADGLVRLYFRRDAEQRQASGMPSSVHSRDRRE